MKHLIMTPSMDAIIIHDHNPKSLKNYLHTSILKTMRLRTIILILALFAFLSASAGSLLYYYSYRTSAFEKTEADAHSRLNLLTDQLSFYLSEHIKPVKTLSGISEIRIVLNDINLTSIYEANRVLDDFTNSLDLEVSYLMNKNGMTICSSNRNAEDSFVGKDFAFRPYFKKAMKGNSATYLALGTTSGKRGVYYSHPVYNTSDNLIIGVVVMKSSVEYVETKLFPESDDIMLFTNPDGLIFIANKERMRSRLLWQLQEKKKEKLLDSRQFGNGPWAWTGFSRGEEPFVLDQNNSKYIYSELDVTNYPSWKIISLRNYEKLENQVSEPFVRVIGPIIISILILTGLLVVVLYQLGIREIAKRKKAEKELRLSEERYRRIYHKTPVMLHSIDIHGKIIRVSDHWVDVMGYKREDVIGKSLIRFFTDESREFAINVIFPEFFSTGFCKDVPYSYIKKNGEKMDIMLSCYGVRDENDTVIRSLAVSVDVTEKNRVQEDLEIAKEKLSQYSHDLEQQVNKRTAQLEKAQENLRKLSKNIIASQEREKASVAGELHDHLGQVLTALRIDAKWAENILFGLDEKSGKRANKMSALIDDTINDVRDMAYRLRPRVLDDLGLADALESLLLDFEKRSNVSCVFKHDDTPEISDTLATALYRIGQEAVTNALKHSNATSIIVELKPDEEGIVLNIEDNGCGFDTEKRLNNEGFGLEGMKERANLVSGKLEIFSSKSPGKSQGTAISCKVRLTNEIRGNS